MQYGLPYVLYPYVRDGNARPRAAAHGGGVDRDGQNLPGQRDAVPPADGGRAVFPAGFPGDIHRPVSNGAGHFYQLQRDFDRRRNGGLVAPVSAYGDQCHPVWQQQRDLCPSVPEPEGLRSGDAGHRPASGRGHSRESEHQLHAAERGGHGGHLRLRQVPELKRPEHLLHVSSRAQREVRRNGGGRVAVFPSGGRRGALPQPPLPDGRRKFLPLPDGYASGNAVGGRHGGLQPHPGRTHGLHGGALVLLHHMGL